MRDGIQVIPPKRNANRLGYESDTSAVLIMLATGKQDSARLGLVHRQVPDAIHD